MSGCVGGWVGWFGGDGCPGEIGGGLGEWVGGWVGREGGTTYEGTVGSLSFSFS